VALKWSHPAESQVSALRYHAEKQKTSKNVCKAYVYTSTDRTDHDSCFIMNRMANTFSPSPYVGHDTSCPVRSLNTGILHYTHLTIH